MNERETPKTNPEKPAKRRIKLVRVGISPLDQMFQTGPISYTPGPLRPKPTPKPDTGKD